jgi:hypothetical protein
MESTIIEQSPKDFVADPAQALTYDPMLGLDYTSPHSPFGVSTLGCECFHHMQFSSLPCHVPVQYAHYVIMITVQNTTSPRMSFEALNMPMGGEYAFSPQPSYISSPPVRPFTPHEGNVYTAALNNNVSAGELSSDSMRQPSPSFVLRHVRRNSGTASPLSTSSGIASIPRTTHRFNPIGVPPATAAARRERKPRVAASASRKGSADDFASDDEDEGEYPSATTTTAAGTEARREEIRRQRIESEQRRRDELRDGYRRLKDALPVSNQKSSKVCLLDRATTHIKYLEMTTQQLQQRVQQAEAEVQRLRQ